MTHIGLRQGATDSDIEDIATDIATSKTSQQNMARTVMRSDNVELEVQKQFMIVWVEKKLSCAGCEIFVEIATTTARTVLALATDFAAKDLDLKGGSEAQICRTKFKLQEALQLLCKKLLCSKRLPRNMARI